MAAATHLYLFDASEDTVSRSAQYDLAWTGANGRIEFANFEKHVARFAALGAKGDIDDVQLLYEIILSRMNTWGAGGFRQFLEASPTRARQFKIVHARIENLRADVERLKEPAARERLIIALGQIAPIIEQIGAEAHTTSVAESAIIKADLRHQQQLQRWLTIMLLASGAAALAFTARQNRSLSAAHLAAARHAEESLFLARHDPLTKLPNRPAFEAAYHAALRAKAHEEEIVIAAIDLDGFKSVNDLLGHAAGDAVLIAFSKLLAGEVVQANGRNIVCRVGGDEFLALLWPAEERTSIMDFAQRILAALERPLETSYGAIMIGASIGLASSSNSMPTDDLLINADLALAEAKARGKGMALSFEPGMLAGLKRRLRLEADLAPAIEKGEFLPYYQPKVNLLSEQVVGLEALARWRHPELGWISPGEFIPVAESSGAIVKIGRLMLHAACRDAANLPGNVGVAVNLSIVQILNDDIVGAVEEALASSGLAPARLTLEITESVMMSDPEKVIEILTRLKKIGVCISLDDFGTGYSALSYLTQFRWDELKIDRSFIGRAWSDPINLAIIRAVKMLAERMNASITVEGVENVEQRDQLLMIGCHTAQGYLFGRPVPFNELRPILLRNVAATLFEDNCKANAEPARRQALTAAK